MRRALLAKVHVAAKALALEEGDYLAVLRRVTGRDSAGACDLRQLAAVVAEFERLGFRAERPVARPVTRRTRPADHPIARKARALWISLHQLGAIDDPSERALERFAARQLGIDRLHWADQRHSAGLIEALKGIAERHGWRQDVPARTPARVAVQLLKLRLLAAIAAKLGEAVETAPADTAALDAAIGAMAARLAAAE